MYGSTFKHNKVLIGHLACIPLCDDFHRGKWGIHRNRSVWIEAHDKEAVFFEKEVQAYSEETGILLPGEEVWAIMDWGR